MGVYDRDVDPDRKLWQEAHDLGFKEGLREGFSKALSILEEDYMGLPGNPHTPTGEAILEVARELAEKMRGLLK